MERAARTEVSVAASLRPAGNSPSGCSGGGEEGAEQVLKVPQFGEPSAGACGSWSPFLVA